MGILFALISAVGFALTYVLIRKGVRPEDPDNGLMITMSINVLILATASVVLWIVVPLPAVHLEAVAWFVAAGLLGPLVGRYTLFGGIRRIGSSRAAAIKNNAPVVTVVVAVAFLGEQLSLTAMFGVALVILGLMMLAHEAFTKGAPGPQPRRDEPVTWTLESEVVAEGALLADVPVRTESVPSRLSSSALTGIGMAALAAVAFGLSQITRTVGLDLTPNAVLGAAVGALAGFASYVAVTALQGRLGRIMVASFASFRPVLWLAGVTSAIGILSFYVAVTFAPVSYVSVVAASETLLTLIFGAVFISRVEAISRRIVIPAVAVFGGTALIAMA